MLRALTCLISVNPHELSAYLRMECNYFTCVVELVLPPLIWKGLTYLCTGETVQIYTHLCPTVASTGDKWIITLVIGALSSQLQPHTFTLTPAPELPVWVWEIYNVVRGGGHGAVHVHSTGLLVTGHRTPGSSYFH